MKGLKMLIAAVGLTVLAAIIIYQQTKIERLAAEAAMLREQIQQQAPMQNQVENPTRSEPSQGMLRNSVSSLTEEQFHELLRLRGEIGVLRAQLAEAAGHPDNRTMSQPYAEPVAQKDADNAPKLADVPVLGEIPVLGELFVIRSNSTPQ